MADKQTFETVLEKHLTMNATGITIPFDVDKEWGAKRVPVIATINKAVYRGSIVRMGGKYMLGIPKAFRDAAGIKAGDNIVVTVERDKAERVVDPPPDLAAAIAENDLAFVWKQLSYTNQKENVRAVIEAKQSETRAKRIAKTIEMLKAKQ
jgi:bifunctional DNA-binding transcriptional regulator/antitoxin component of YhaV-PrlF toxin-antitoxin module